MRAKKGTKNGDTKFRLLKIHCQHILFYTITDIVGDRRVAWGLRAWANYLAVVTRPGDFFGIFPPLAKFRYENASFSLSPRYTRLLSLLLVFISTFFFISRSTIQFYYPFFISPMHFSLKRHLFSLPMPSPLAFLFIYY